MTNYTKEYRKFYNEKKSKKFEMWLRDYYLEAFQMCRDHAQKENRDF